MATCYTLAEATLTETTKQVLIKAGGLLSLLGGSGG